MNRTFSTIYLKYCSDVDVDVAASPAATWTVFDISDTMQFLQLDKASSISQLIRGKWNLNWHIFNGITTSVSNLSLSSSNVHPIIFVLYSKDIIVIVFLLFPL